MQPVQNEGKKNRIVYGANFFARVVAINLYAWTSTLVFKYLLHTVLKLLPIFPYWSPFGNWNKYSHSWNHNFTVVYIFQIDVKKFMENFGPLIIFIGPLAGYLIQLMIFFYCYYLYRKCSPHVLGKFNLLCWLIFSSSNFPNKLNIFLSTYSSWAFVDLNKGNNEVPKIFPFNSWCLLLPFLLFTHSRCTSPYYQKLIQIIFIKSNDDMFTEQLV